MTYVLKTRLGQDSVSDQQTGCASVHLDEVTTVYRSDVSEMRSCVSRSIYVIPRIAAVAGEKIKPIIA